MFFSFNIVYIVHQYWHYW